MCRVWRGRIPTGGFPNIVFNFLKAARDPETASPPEPGTQAPGGRVNPASPSQSPQPPAPCVGGDPGLEEGWAGAEGCAESAEIENPRHSGRIEAQGLQMQLGNSPVLQPVPGRPWAHRAPRFAGGAAL